MFFDTHLHLDLFAEPKEIIKAIDSQKYYSIAVTNLPQVFMKTKELCQGSKYIRPALGYHPELVYKFNNQFELFKELLNETRYVGEIGIDNLRKTAEDFNSQKLIFEKIVGACAEKKNKILTIHSRRAEKEVISIIGNRFPGKTILHWYSGSISDLEKAVSFGFYFSINYAMTQSKNGINIIKNIPPDRLLLESDSPFIGVDKNSVIPLNMQPTISEISTIKKISILELNKILNQNFKTLLS
ncbi:TatD family deoxyribonuclease [Chryseobacterium bernardetii]|uniref:TatD family deoxyribonuclease n=1 Tax=Chryseobacterium bernardetii TaxID=1241978 RepID=A0A3G6T9U0_9FLAO|nr:Qat anti-phage system TatD family nuclease QatD [Chryseobacterium bernardetii]AZB26001.1 TatD family deoxyribonuclease [Chryseobacterium bernardetii]